MDAAAAPIRVLLVEDDEGHALIVRLLFEESEAPIEVTHVRRLAEAERIAVGFDCALLDLDLPDAGGFEGLERLRAAASDLAILVLTGMADENRGTAALAAGAQDYLVKGHVDGDMLARAVRYSVERRRADAAMRALSLAQVQTAENRRLERGLLPIPLVEDPRLGIVTRYVTGSRRSLLGGDFFDVVEDRDGCLRALIGDVAGHGPDEAATGVCLRIGWRALVLAGLDDVSVLTLLQEIIEAERPSPSLFATVATVAIDSDRKHLKLCCAGHPPPLLVPADGPARALAERSSGPPVGVIAGQRWAPVEVDLRPGWSLLLYTDGLIEGRSGGNGRLGQDGLVELVRDVGLPAADADGAISALVARVEELNGGPLTDDLALVYLSAP